MNDVEIVLKFKELCDKKFTTPDAMKRADLNISYQSGVQVVKNDLAKLVLELIQQQVDLVKESNKLPEDEVTKDNVSMSVRAFLILRGYTVFYYPKLELWQATDVNKNSLIRGGDLTEDGAWYFCYKDYMRSK